MPSQSHGLSSRSATEIGNQRFIRQIIYKTQCLKSHIGTSRTLSFHIQKKLTNQINIDFKNSFIFVTHDISNNSVHVKIE